VPAHAVPGAETLISKRPSELRPGRFPTGGVGFCLKAFKRDIPGAEIHFFDTGHFALETHCAEIAAAIRDFLARTPGLSSGNA
jgi:pimeloyl-ACP methyl ester carboxylesterase